MYLCPNGDKLPSVTTVLAFTKLEKDKQGLNEWKQRVGHKQAAIITHEAASRGTRLHTFLENYMLGDSLSDPGTNPYSKQSHRMAQHIINNAFKNVTEFYGTEISIFYPKLYAGTTDVIFLDDGEIVLGDFKQSNKVKRTDWIHDYFLQISSYILAHDELYGTKIQKGKIMMCTPELIYQEWVLEGDELTRYKDLWWERLYQYYDKKLGA
jgi:genome maintenance exonuclease 1